MNCFKNWFFSIVATVTIISCDNEMETRNVIDTGTDTMESKIALKNYSSALKNLVKTDEGVFRGMRLGIPASEVKEQEDTAQGTQLEEKGQNYMDYMVNYDELENAEVRYVFGPKDRLSKIEVNIYPKSKESQDSLYAEFSDYFTSRYGNPGATPDSKKWESKEKDLFILMEKKDTHKVHDIHLVITSLTRQTAFIPQETLPEDQ